MKSIYFGQGYYPGFRVWNNVRTLNKLLPMRRLHVGKDIYLDLTDVCEDVLRNVSA